MSQANKERFEKLNQSAELWGFLMVLIAIVAPAVVASLSTLNQLPVL